MPWYGTFYLLKYIAQWCGPQPVGVGASPDRRYPGSAGVAGQRYPAGGASPLRGGGYSPGDRYPGTAGVVTSSPIGGSYPARKGLVWSHFP